MGEEVKGLKGCTALGPPVLDQPAHIDSWWVSTQAAFIRLLLNHTEQTKCHFQLLDIRKAYINALLGTPVNVKIPSDTPQVIKRLLKRTFNKNHDIIYHTTIREK